MHRRGVYEGGARMYPQTRDEQLSRRSVLRWMSLGVGAGLLAACGPAAAPPAPTPLPAAPTPPPAKPTAAPQPQATVAPTSAPTAAPAAAQSTDTVAAV